MALPFLSPIPDRRSTINTPWHILNRPASTWLEAMLLEQQSRHRKPSQLICQFPCHRYLIHTIFCSWWYLISIQSLFQEKDYLNYRYFYKRAYYIACVAAGLQDNPEIRFDVKYEYLNGNLLQPILRLDLVRGKQTRS